LFKLRAINHLILSTFVHVVTIQTSTVCYLFREIFNKENGSPFFTLVYKCQNP